MHDFLFSNRQQTSDNLAEDYSSLLLIQISTSWLDESVKVPSIAEFKDQVIVVARLGRCPELDHILVSYLFQEPHFVLEQGLELSFDFLLVNHLDGIELVWRILLVGEMHLAILSFA